MTKAIYDLSKEVTYKTPTLGELTGGLDTRIPLNPTSESPKPPDYLALLNSDEYRQHFQDYASLRYGSMPHGGLVQAYMAMPGENGQYAAAPKELLGGLEQLTTQFLNDPQTQLTGLLRETQGRNRDLFYPIEDKWLASYAENPNLAKARADTTEANVQGRLDRNNGRLARMQTRYGRDSAIGANSRRLNRLATSLGTTSRLNNARFQDINRRDEMDAQLLNASLSQLRQATGTLGSAVGLQQDRERARDAAQSRLDQIISARRAAEKADDDHSQSLWVSVLGGIGAEIIEDTNWDFLNGLFD